MFFIGGLRGFSFWIVVFSDVVLEIVFKVEWIWFLLRDIDELIFE